MNTLHCGHPGQYVYEEGKEVHCALCAIADLNQRLIDRTTGFMQTLGQQALEIAHWKAAHTTAQQELLKISAAYERAVSAGFRLLRENSYHFLLAQSLAVQAPLPSQRMETPIGEAEAHLQALQQAYVHNQNMHCFTTKGRLNDQLNEQTHLLRKALGIPETTAPSSANEHPSIPE